MHDSFRKSGGPQNGHHGHHGHHSQPEDDIKKLPAGLLASLVLLMLVFGVAFTMVAYTYASLLPHLAMVEVPSSILVESTVREEYVDLVDVEDSKDTTKAPLMDEHREAAILTQEPITNNLFATVRHLRAIGGRLAAFRGVAIFYVYSVLLSTIQGALTFIGPLIGHVIAATVLTVPHMAWIHIITTTPSEKAWFRRLPSMAEGKKAFVKLAPMTAVVAIAEIVPVFICGLFMPRMPAAIREPGNKNPNTNDEQPIHLCALQFLFAALIMFAWCGFIVMPLRAVLARLSVTRLQENEETVINVQREEMTVKEAYKSFDWNAWARVAKAYIKGVAIQTAVAVLFFLAAASLVGVWVGFDGDELKRRTFVTFFKPPQ